MNDLIKICSLILFLCIPISIYGSNIKYKGKYISINSLSKNDCSRLISIDIKNKTINFDLGYNKQQTFRQENDLDSAQYFIEQNLISKLGKNITLLKIKELKRVENDSIYVSASYQSFDEKGNTGKIINIENLAICRYELLGVMVSPPINEVRKKNKTLYWLIGLATITVVTMSLIFGQ